MFVEPLAHNPALRLFRAVTPAIRTPDEHPLTMTDLEDFERRFDAASVEFHSMPTLAAMPPQQGRRFPALLRTLEGLDDAGFARAPWFRRWAWMSVLEGSVAR